MVDKGWKRLYRAVTVFGGNDYIYIYVSIYLYIYIYHTKVAVIFVALKRLPNRRTEVHSNRLFTTFFVVCKLQHCRRPIVIIHKCNQKNSVMNQGNRL